eukprot:gene28651-34593_t
MSAVVPDLGGLDGITDVELISTDIRAKCESDCPVVIFQHMVEHELSNLSIVQSNLVYLRESKKYKILHYFGLGGRSAAVAFMLTEQYVLDLQQKLAKSSPLLYAQFSEWIMEKTNISVSASELHDLVGLSTEDISVLCDLGFLRQRSDVLAEEQRAYWVSHPAITYVGYHLASAERFVLAAIKRTRFKEMNSKDFYSLFLHHTQSTAAKSSSSSKQVEGVEKNQSDEPMLKRVRHSNSSISIDDLYSQKGKRKEESSKKQAASPLPAYYHLLDLLGRKVLTAVPSADNRSLLLRIAN